MRLPEKCFEWQVDLWKFGVILCPGIWRVSFWWDGNPYSLTITLPLMHIWFEHDGGNLWPWEWTILRLVIGKQEIRTDLALNYWGLGVAVHQTDDWSIHLGPIDIECEQGKFYDLDADWIGPAHFRLFARVRVPRECEHDLHGDGGQCAPEPNPVQTQADPSDAGPAG